MLIASRSHAVLLATRLFEKKEGQSYGRLVSHFEHPFVDVVFTQPGDQRALVTSRSEAGYAQMRSHLLPFSSGDMVSGHSLALVPGSEAGGDPVIASGNLVALSACHAVCDLLPRAIPGERHSEGAGMTFNSFLLTFCQEQF